LFVQIKTQEERQVKGDVLSCPAFFSSHLWQALVPVDEAQLALLVQLQVGCFLIFTHASDLIMK